MASPRGSVPPNSFGEANVFSPGVRKRKVSPGSAVEGTLESAAERLDSGERAMHGRTESVCCRDGGRLVNRRENRQAFHEVSGDGTAGHGYRGRTPIRIIVPMPQRGQRLRSFSVMASSS